MASFRIFGPYNLDLGVIGLAPGQAQGTYWFGWQPEPRDGQFTVTVTGHPSTDVAGSVTGTRAANALSVSDTSVQYVPSIQGDLVSTQLIVNATLVNSGPAAIRYCSLCITFVEL
jgi:hypothetical protein